MTTPAAGTHALGSFDVVAITPPEGPVPILADLIDPVTGDFADLLRSAKVSDGLLVEAYRVERGSGPAVNEVGHTLRKVRHTDEGAVAEIKARAVKPVEELADAGVLELRSISVEVDEDEAVLDLAVRDLTEPDVEESRKPFTIPRRPV